MIGDKVRELRIMANMSQMELSEKTGISPGHISEIETGGRKDLQINTLKKLAKGLNVSVAVLLDDESTTPKGVK